MSNLSRHLWIIQNKGLYELVYTKIEDFDPKIDWYDTKLSAVKYKGELFSCSTLEQAIDTILIKYPESIERDKHTNDMTGFCKNYVDMLLSSVSERSINSHSKSNSELFSIVIGGRAPTQEMYNDEQLNKLKTDSIYIKVYSFVRDNIEKFTN